MIFKEENIQNEEKQIKNKMILYVKKLEFAIIIDNENKTLYEGLVNPDFTYRKGRLVSNKEG